MDESFTYVRVLVIGLSRRLRCSPPLSLVFYQSFLTAPFFQPAARLTLNAYAFVLGESRVLDRLRHHLVAGRRMTLIAVPLGAGLAFLMARAPDVPGRAWLEPVILIPIFVSAVSSSPSAMWWRLDRSGSFDRVCAPLDRASILWNLYSLLR